RYVWAENNYYEGEFKEGNFNGHGKRVWESGNYYEGEFLDDKLHGEGTYHWTDGTYYKGEFADGKRNGFGRYVWAENNYYEGEFADGDFNGHGKRVWDDGDVYEGEFRNDQYHGYGKLVLADGSIQEGEWENGTFLGETIPAPTTRSTPVSAPVTPSYDEDDITSSETEPASEDVAPSASARSSFGSSGFGKSGKRKKPGAFSAPVIEDSPREILGGVGSPMNKSDEVEDIAIADDVSDINVGNEDVTDLGLDSAPVADIDSENEDDINLDEIEQIIDDILDDDEESDEDNDDVSWGDDEGFEVEEGFDDEKKTESEEEIISDRPEPTIPHFDGPPPAEDTYEGARNIYGQPSGNGTMRYANGDIYQGEWHNGQWFGEGVYVASDGKIYIGAFFRNKQSNSVIEIDGTSRREGTMYRGGIFVPSNE
ncbi:MAG: hypothetical protein IKA43_04885, partial [Clostridia bacterium]|nr:hypothetical protein [Clostridia bacterium]